MSMRTGMNYHAFSVIAEFLQIDLMSGAIMIGEIKAFVITNMAKISQKITNCIGGSCPVIFGDFSKNWKKKRS